MIVVKIKINKRSKTIRIEERVYDNLKKMSDNIGVTISDLASKMIEYCLKKCDNLQDRVNPKEFYRYMNAYILSDAMKIEKEIEREEKIAP